MPNWNKICEQAWERDSLHTHFQGSPFKTTHRTDGQTKHVLRENGNEDKLSHETARACSLTQQSRDKRA